MAETETFSLRLTPDLKLRFQETIKTSNLKQEEFVTTLLSAYEAQAQEQGGTVSQEKSQVRSGLDRLRILLEAVIDRAEDQSRQAVSDVEQSKKAYDEEKESFQQLIEEQVGRIEKIEAENIQLKENEESRNALKQAFQEKEEVWATREEDQKNKVAELTGKLASISEENIRLRQDADTLKNEKDEINAALASSRKEIDEIRNKHQLSLKDIEIEAQKEKDEINAMLASSRKEIDEIRNNHQLNLKDIEIEAQNKIAKITLSLKQECDAKIEALRTDYKGRIKETKTEERSIWENRFTELKEQLKNSQEIIKTLAEKSSA